MNVFVIGWNLSTDCQAAAVNELRNIVGRYPALDAKTSWSVGQGSRAFAASILMTGNSAALSVYVNRSDHGVTMFDGCPLDPSGRFNALDAADLCAFWPDLPGALDGQFFAAKVSFDPPRIEIINDLLGVYQAYYIQLESTWIISNSVHLLDKLSGGRGFDPFGVSLFMCRGAAGGDRTLKEGIRVIHGAQHWCFTNGDLQPRRSTYFKQSSLANLKQCDVDRAAVRSLADKMVRNIQGLGSNYGHIQCPITAGRDTRVLMGLTLRSGVEAKYFTNGNPDSPDVRIGSAIARSLNLSHQIRRRPDDDEENGIKDVIDRWDQLSKEHVRRTDGMISLRCAAEASPVPWGSAESKSLFLFGMGGEIARGYLTSPTYYTRRHTKDFMLRHLVGALRQGYVRPAALALAKEHMRQFIDGAISEGFRIIDIPSLLFAYENVRRWAATHFMDSILQGRVLYAPFCDRIFLESAFSMPAICRYSENLHYELIQHLAPELHTLPYEKPWLSRSTAWNRATFWVGQISGGRARRGRRAVSGATIDRAQDRSAVLEARRSSIKSLCLDQKESPLWELIDRERFERVMADTTTPSERHRDHRNIFAIATMFQYAALQE